MAVSIAILHHKWNERSLVIMHMHNIRMMFPFAYPIYHCNLKSHESFDIIAIAINFLAVKQSVDIYEVKIEPKNIGDFPYNSVFKIIMRHSKCALVYYFKLMLIQKFGPVHGHYHFSNVPQFILVFW